jgi:hypothetical protein
VPPIGEQVIKLYHSIESPIRRIGIAATSGNRQAHAAAARTKRGPPEALAGQNGLTMITAPRSMRRTSSRTDSPVFLRTLRKKSDRGFTKQRDRAAPPLLPKGHKTHKRPARTASGPRPTSECDIEYSIDATTTSRTDTAVFLRSLRKKPSDVPTPPNLVTTHEWGRGSRN